MKEVGEKYKLVRNKNNKEIRKIQTKKENRGKWTSKEN